MLTALNLTMSDTKENLDEHSNLNINSNVNERSNNGLFIDGTFGRGGHSQAILSKLTAKGRLFAMDRDPEALPFALNIAKNDPRFFFQPGPFSELYKFCESQAILGKIDGLLLDLGVSSPQLDKVERGFSFREEGPLDMRMDPNSGISAKEWINQAEESEIDAVLKNYGEERFHRRIAHAIIRAREASPINTTSLLAEIISKANPAWEKYKHPATRSFQAIRIFINNELNELSSVLEQSISILKPGGRLVVISFHSLEDRIVKQFIQQCERGDRHPRGLPIFHHQFNQTMKRINGPQKPSNEEVEQNVRARSAILRAAVRLETGNKKIGSKNE